MTDAEKAEEAEEAEEENNVGITFKKSYAELEKENAKLKAQIEKMKKDLFDVANKNTPTERLASFWDMFHKYLD